MIIRRLLMLLLIINSIGHSYGQFIYYDQDLESDSLTLVSLFQEGLNINDSLKAQGYKYDTYFIHEVGDKLWMTIDGRFDVYEWRNSKWKNLYKGGFHGYNFLSQKFTFNNKLYSYRGYGFWRHHGDIIEFLPDRNEWEIVHFSIELPFGIGYIVDSTFYIHAEECYEVELLNSTIQEVDCKFSLNGEFPKERAYVFKDHVLIACKLENGTQSPLIEKESGKVFTSRRLPFRRMEIPNTLIHMRDREMTVVFSDSSSINYSIDNQMKYYKPANVGEESISLWLWLGFSSVFILIIYVLFRGYKKSRIRSEHPISDEFRKYDGKLIDSDELDRILEIEDITVYETKKYKRAVKIKELNNLSQAIQNKDLIVREKDPNDKRFYLYRIQYS